MCSLLLLLTTIQPIPGELASCHLLPPAKAEHVCPGSSPQAVGRQANQFLHGTRSEGERKVPGPGPSPSSQVPHNSDSQGSCQLGWLCACMLSRFSHDQLFVTLYWPRSHSRAIPSFPSQLEWKIGLAWANTRGSLNSPS